MNQPAQASVPPLAALSVLPVVTGAGMKQGLCLILCGSMPPLAVTSLVPALPQLMTHFADHPQAGWLVPMILTAPSIMIVLLSSAMGLLADVWGRRPLMLLSLLAFTLFGVLPLWLDNLYAILAARLAMGVAEAGISTVFYALMGDYFKGAARDQWLGRQVMFGPVIGSVYILTGGALGGVNWHAPFLMYLLGIPLLGWAVLSLWEPTPDIRAARSDSRDAATEAGTFPWKVTWRIGAVTLVASVIFFLQLIQHGRIFSELGVGSATQIGVFVTVAGLGQMAGGWWYSRLAAWHVGQKMALMFSLYAVGYIGLANASTLWVGLTFDLIAMVGSGLLPPVLMSWALAQYAFHHRGRGMGLWNAFFSTAQFASPVVVAAVGLGTDRFLGSLGVIGAVAAGLALLSWLARDRLEAW